MGSVPDPKENLVSEWLHVPVGRILKRESAKSIGT